MVFLHGDSWTPAELFMSIAKEALIAGGLLLLVHWVYQKGLVRYSAFGG
jgi:hypothetical protein